jgi:site-specific DNA-methyltransferase (adenine-specific)
MIWPDDYINTVICGDCLEVMKGIPDGAVDLVVTDPPYGMSFLSNHRFVKHARIWGDSELPVGAIRVAMKKAGRATYVFCRWDNLPSMPQPTSVLCWVKNNWSMGDLKHEHGRQWEAICFYPMAGHEFIKRIPDVILGDRTGNVWHPTQKPVCVVAKIIAANVGDIILDPFAGSGTTLVAAKQLGRKYIGIEINENYCDIARQRLAQEELFG